MPPDRILPAVWMSSDAGRFESAPSELRTRIMHIRSLMMLMLTLFDMSSESEWSADSLRCECYDH